MLLLQKRNEFCLIPCMIHACSRPTWWCLHHLQDKTILNTLQIGASTLIVARVSKKYFKKGAVENLKTVMLHCKAKPGILFIISEKTRKSSCVNARGIPTAAYQVLFGGVPPIRVPPGQVWPGGYLRWGTPCQGTPGQVWWGGYPRWGTPIRPGWGDTRGGVPSIGVASQPGLTGGTQGEVPPTWTWLGYPQLDLAGVPPTWIWLGYPPRLDLARVPPTWSWLGYPPSPAGPGQGTPPRCGQTDWWTDMCQNITFPGTTYAVGENQM